MSQKVFTINSTAADYNDDELQFLESLKHSDGVLADNETGALGLAVTERTVPDMNVEVAIGNAFIEVTVGGRTLKVVLQNTAVETIAIANNITGANRVDAIIARVDVDTEPDALKTNIGTLERVAGTGVAALTDGAIDTAVGSDGWIRLADIVVPDSATAINDSDITDTRQHVQMKNAVRLNQLFITLSSTADPSDSVEGSFWYDSVRKVLRYKDDVGAKSIPTTIGEFCDGSDGDVVLDGTNTYAGFLSKSGSEYTMTRDMLANNLTIESGATLTTDGYVIKVRDTIDGAGTVRHSDPTGHEGGAGGSATGAGGGSGAASGIVLIYASEWDGTFTIEAIGSAGGAGGTGGTGTGAGGAGGTQRGAGLLRGVAGKVGAAGVAGTATGINGTGGTASDPCIGSAGARGGDGYQTASDNVSEGSGGGGGAATAPDFSPEEARFLISLFQCIKTDGALEQPITVAGSGSGGSGGNDGSPAQSGRGGGGGGGNGGFAYVVFKNKSWTGTSDLSGGAKGALGGGGIGDELPAGWLDSEAGNAGSLVEVQITELI